jgi:hypothetical protein
VVKNEIFQTILRLEPELRTPGYHKGSPVSIMTISEAKLDEMLGWEARSGGRDSSKSIRSHREVAEQLRRYFEHFRVKRPTLKMMMSAGVAPPWARRLTSEFDEPVDLSISRSPHNDSIEAHAFFSSLRTVHVRVQNISPHALSDVELHVVASGFGTKGALVSLVTPLSTKRVHFTVKALQPNEAIVYPLKVQLVPHLEAAGSAVGMAEIQKLWSGDRLSDDSAIVVSSRGQSAVDLYPSHEFQGAAFHVQGKPVWLHEVPKVNTERLIRVSNTEGS